MKIEVEEGRSQPILLLETEKARYIQQFLLKRWALTGGMTVESKVERQEKSEVGKKD